MNRRNVIATGTALAATPTLGQAMSTELASGFKLRRSEDRFMATHGWLQSAHTFNFASFFHPDHMNFESLRVINDDIIAPGMGFPMHPHANFEIFSYVLDGALEHKDTMGNGSVVTSGGVQYMSAGSGVSHSEFNPSQDARTQLLQIWLMPNVQNEAPRYETMDIDPADKDGKLKLFLSKDGRDGSMHIKADADIYAATLDGDQTIAFDMPAGNRAWIQMANGSLTVNGQSLDVGDGLAVTQSGRLEFSGGQDAEFLLFNLEPFA